MSFVEGVCILRNISIVFSIGLSPILQVKRGLRMSRSTIVMWSGLRSLTVRVNVDMQTPSMTCCHAHSPPVSSFGCRGDPALTGRRLRDWPGSALEEEDSLPLQTGLWEKYVLGSPASRTFIVWHSRSFAWRNVLEQLASKSCRS